MVDAGLALGVGVSFGLARAGRRTGIAAVTAALGVFVALVAFVVAIGPHDAMATRLNVSSPDRGRETSAAFDLVTSWPLTGVEPGGASLRWTDTAGEVMVARCSHAAPSVRPTRARPAPPGRSESCGASHRIGPDATCQPTIAGWRRTPKFHDRPRRGRRSTPSSPLATRW